MMGRDNITRTGARAPGVKRETACTEVFISALPLTQSRESRRTQGARRAMANQCSGKAAPEIPALKPYRGKPAVRNFREGDGNVGIIRSPLRAIVLPDLLGRVPGAPGSAGLCPRACTGKRRADASA